MSETILAVPWLSQWGPGADFGVGDGSMACVTMLLRALGQQLTVDDLSRAAQLTPGFKWVHVDTLRHVAQQRQLDLMFAANDEMGLSRLENEILGRRPVIVLVNYGVLPDAHGLERDRSRYVLVVGVGADSIVYHDPNWPAQAGGAFVRIPKTTFDEAWANNPYVNDRRQGLLLTTTAVPVVGRPGFPPWTTPPPTWRRVIWAITSIFESGQPEGDPAAYQTLDSGIISYGKHQATLQSGTLGVVVDAYFKRSHSATSQELRAKYAQRIKSKEAKLRYDQRLRDLLLNAATEEAMREAQDDVFDAGFYQPAIEAARSHRTFSPLALACLYDTRVQSGAGGLKEVLNRTTLKVTHPIAGALPADPAEEASWLQVFLGEREARLEERATASEVGGDDLSAKLIRTSKFRVRELRSLLEADNLALSGQLTIRGRKLQGLSPA